MAKVKDNFPRRRHLNLRVICLIAQRLFFVDFFANVMQTEFKDKRGDIKYRDAIMKIMLTSVLLDGGANMLQRKKKVCHSDLHKLFFVVVVVASSSSALTIVIC